MDQSNSEIFDNIVLLTYVLSGIGLIIGLLVSWFGFLSSFNSPQITIEPLDDPLPDFTGFFIFIGISFTGVALFSFIGNFLFKKKNILGWLMLILVYATGTLISGYILFISLKQFATLALMSPMLIIYILLLLIGLYILYNLILNGSIRKQFVTF
ncbi:MAG: hypothetical protein ACXACX_14610 [Candidatus Hodarchaeales archaeon]|jgi:magnesium-transporting ATPase (P-type)